ncbi:MAG: molybdopterin-synthase adenylyltransferase MoeB [Gammaproteobacteria bacterium]|nr:molybdopterin-synthase adenylyltransferase MoeB [Gammaproteobacteria bacterium]MBQ0838528.1 molybdopterin-synthase adenylyltransferase MoeB [Gammaproteobacteria bacterium]
MAKKLDEHQRKRYTRQLLLPSFGFDGQEQLAASTVLVLGVGGLGCAAAQYLCTAGVGRLILVDDDRVELSNLHRQVLHGEDDIGRLKVESADDSLRRLNPAAAIETVTARLDDVALLGKIKSSQLVLDCSDNLATRRQLNRLCFEAKTPLVSGAAIRFEGQIAVYPMTESAPCYECFSQRFGEQQLSCVESGVLAPLVGIVGSLQALEAIKLLSGVGTVPSGRLMLFDGAHSQWQSFTLEKLPGCTVCGGA